MPYQETPGSAVDDWNGELNCDGQHIYGGSELSNEYVNNACHDARVNFFTRPKYVAHKALQSVSSPAEFVRNLKAFQTFLPAVVKSCRQS